MADSEKSVEVNIVGESEGDADGDGNTVSQNGEHDPHFEPIITLPEVHISTMEEDEVELIKLRAKLYRYDNTSQLCSPEWKERGTGEVKLLRHETKHTVRVVMRRDKTLKLCANHYVTPYMELKPNCGSDRAWVWSVLADYADEIAQPQLLAIKFANANNAKQWKEVFDEAKHIVETQCELYNSVSESLENLNLEDESNAEESIGTETLDNVNTDESPKKENILTETLNNLKVDESPAKENIGSKTPDNVKTDESPAKENILTETLNNLKIDESPAKENNLDSSKN